MARKKKDEAHDETDRVIEETEKKIRKEYAQAEKEIDKKLNDFLSKFEAEDEAMRQKLADGEITKDYYRKWRTTRMATGQRWEALRDEIAEDMANANGLARSTINGHAADVYAVNRNFATYQIESEAKINTSFTLYNRRAVEDLMNNDESLLPAPRKGSDAWKAMMDKDLRWNQQKINSSLIQGLLQGDSIPEIRDRLLNVVGMNETSAMRSARTMMTYVQNLAREDSYEELEKKGIELETVWVATLDDRTRHSHRLLHGEVKGDDGKYSNGLRFPADPAGDPAEIYNCRCTELSHVKGFPIDIPKWSPKMGDMTFEEWQGVQEEGAPVDEKQDEKEEKTWDAMQHVVDNDMSLKDLRSYMPSENYNDLYTELYADSSSTDYTVDEYFQKVRDGEIENKKVTELINNLTNEEMLSDKGYALLANAETWDMDKIPLTKLTAPKAFEDFVNDVGGGDLTKGSCASLSFCYAANNAGYDVRDFRGGSSRIFFSAGNRFRAMAELSGVTSFSEDSKTPIKTAVNLLKQIPMDTKYILGIGRHAAVVEHTEEGYRYLELQAPKGNGWYKLTSDALRSRFGATKTSRYGDMIDLIEVDSLSKNKYFLQLMEFINTDEGSQQKGERGGRK